MQGRQRRAVTRNIRRPRNLGGPDTVVRTSAAVGRLELLGELDALEQRIWRALGTLCLTADSNTVRTLRDSWFITSLIAFCRERDRYLALTEQMFSASLPNSGSSGRGGSPRRNRRRRGRCRPWLARRCRDCRAGKGHSG